MTHPPACCSLMRDMPPSSLKRWQLRRGLSTADANCHAVLRHPQPCHRGHVKPCDAQN